MTTINANFINGFSETDIVRAQEAIRILEETINSDEFKTTVRNVPSFKNPRIKSRTGRKQYSSKEILDLILSGQDLNNPADGVINLNLQLYDIEKSEIGNTDIKTLIISTYRGYFENKDIKCYAAHLLHEYMHVIGFTHGFLNIFGRDRTVPYKIGSIFRKIVNIDC